MMRTARALMIAIGLGGSACGGKGGSSATVPTTPPAPAAPAAPADAAVSEGGGWTRQAPGAWKLVPEGLTHAEQSLVAPSPGRGIQVFELPAGATAASLAALHVVFTGSGKHRWTVHAWDGQALGAALGTGEFEVATDQVSTKGGAPIWVEQPLSATLNGAFAIVFETIAGAPAVAADHGAGATLLFQPDPQRAPSPVELRPMIQIALRDVR